MSSTKAIPDTYALVLVGQVSSCRIVVVEGLDHSRSTVWVEEVLDAALRCKVVEVARELGDLEFVKMLNVKGVCSESQKICA